MVCVAAEIVLSNAVLSVAIAEVNGLLIAQQYGIAYLKFLVMQRDNLIEKHAKVNGLGDVTVIWQNCGNVMYDAVFSGDLQFASGDHAAAHRMGDGN
jgi:NitT/TauT family transport system substrate-binding protein